MKKIISLILALLICMSIPAFATVHDYEALIGDAIDLANYEPDIDEDSASFWRNESPYTTFDFTVSIENGPSIALNGQTRYQDLLDLGWTSNMPDIAEGQYSYFNSCYSPEKNWISISLFNPSASNAPIAETYVNSVTISADEFANIDLSGINFESKVADVVAKFGEPYSIYSAEYTVLSMKFQDENFSTLQFLFDETGTVVEAAYSYNRSLLVP